MLPDILIIIAGVATAVCVVFTAYALLKKEPSAQVTVKSNGRTEAFRISPEDAASLRVLLEREAQAFRERSVRNPHSGKISVSG